MKEKQRIVIAEDHTILREGLRALLTSDSGFDVVGEAEDGRDAVRCVENRLPDLVFCLISFGHHLRRKAIGRGGHFGTILPIERTGSAIPPLPQMADAKILQDLIKPGEKSPAGFDVFHVPVGSNKGLL